MPPPILARVRRQRDAFSFAIGRTGAGFNVERDALILFDLRTPGLWCSPFLASQLRLTGGVAVCAATPPVLTVTPPRLRRSRP
jgi:hypothetical protein